MNSPTSEVNVRTTNTSKWGQSRIKTIICQMCVNISWSLVLLFLQFSSKNTLWHHVPFGRLHLLEEKKGRRSHPWMLRNFILVPHSWTWRPTRLETGERNTTHHKAWLPVSKKKNKKKTNQRALLALFLIVVMPWSFLTSRSNIPRGCFANGIDSRFPSRDLRALPRFWVFIPWKDSVILSPFHAHEPWQKCGIYSRNVFKGEQTLHNIHLPVSQFHIQNAIAWDLSNTPKNPRPQRSQASLSLLRAELPPFFGTPSLHTCVGIAITQLIKRHSSIWKWLAVETHSQLQSLDPGSADSTGLAVLLHITFLSNGEWLQTCFCYTNLFPSSKPSMGLHWKEVVYFGHGW